MMILGISQSQAKQTNMCSSATENYSMQLYPYAHLLFQHHTTSVDGVNCTLLFYVKFCHVWLYTAYSGIQGFPLFSGAKYLRGNKRKLVRVSSS
jgi:hypothetical protein